MSGVFLGIAGILSACSDVPDALNPVSWWDGVFGDEDEGPPPSVKTVPETSAAKPAAAAKTTQTAQAGATKANGEQSFPTLQEVPDKPATSTVEQRHQMMEGLAADRAHAQYADQSARSAAESAKAPAPAAGSSMETTAAASPAEATPAPAPAPTPAPAPAKSAEPMAETPPPPPAATGHKTYMSGIETEPEAAAKAPPPPPPPAPEKSAAAPAKTAPPPAEPEGVTPPAPGSSELRNAYEQALNQSAPTVTTAPAGPTAKMAPPPGSVAEAPGMPEKPAAPKSALPKSTMAMNEPSTPSVQVFDGAYGTGYGAGMDGAGLTGAPGQIGVVYFRAGSAALDNSDIAKLRKVAEVYKQRGGRLRVVGHASSFTEDMSPVQHQMLNFNISVRRADAVAHELTRLGVSAANISVTAKSDADPVYYESMPAGRAGNQRAEIFIDY